MEKKNSLLSSFLFCTCTKNFPYLTILWAKNFKMGIFLFLPYSVFLIQFIHSEKTYSNRSTICRYINWKTFNSWMLIKFYWPQFTCHHLILIKVFSLKYFYKYLTSHRTSIGGIINLPLYLRHQWPWPRPCPQTPEVAIAPAGPATTAGAAAGPMTAAPPCPAQPRPPSPQPPWPQARLLPTGPMAPAAVTIPEGPTKAPWIEP